MTSVGFSFVMGVLLFLSTFPSQAQNFERRWGPPLRRLTPDMILEGRSLQERRQSNDMILSQTSLSHGVLYHLDRLAEDLIRWQSPSEVDYVAVGTSPSLLVEVLRERSKSMGSPARILHLPLSLSDFELWEERPNLDLHFRQALAGASFTGERPLVFIDFAGSGKTMTNLAIILADMKERGILTRPMAFYALYRAGEHSLPDKIRLNLERLAPDIFNSKQVYFKALPPILDSYFAQRSFKQFSPYQSWSARMATRSLLPIIPVDPNEKDLSDSSFVRTYSRNEMFARLREYFSSAEVRTPRFRLCFGAHSN